VIRSLAITGAIAALLAALFPASAGAAEPRTTLPDVEDEVMCTICGTLLAESDSPQADRERALIRELIAQGKDKEQIKDALVAEYGPRVLATPGGSGFDLLAWLVPGIGILLAAGAVAYGISRALRDTSNRETPSIPLDPEDAARLEADLRRHDL
jgi:cytochrome c-type biogenesis protein CcmH